MQADPWSHEPPQRKILITGTGRCGTSAVMQVLSALGLPTGFKGAHHGIFPGRNAGQEVVLDPASPDIGSAIEHSPRIIKDPRLIRSLPALMDHGLDPLLVYVLVRDVQSASRSRLEQGMVWLEEEYTGEPITSRTPARRRARLQAQQERYLREGLGILLEQLVLREVRFVPVIFPRVVEDPEYFACQFIEVIRALPLQSTEALSMHAAAQKRIDLAMAAHRRICDPRLVRHR